MTRCPMGKDQKTCANRSVFFFLAQTSADSLLISSWDYLVLAYIAIAI